MFIQNTYTRKHSRYINIQESEGKEGEAYKQSIHTQIHMKVYLYCIA
jgi:hypothetical protein